MNRFLAILFFSINSLTVLAQGSFPNTLFFNDSLGSPKADLSTLDWIQGLWRGEAFGGITEEVWTPALGGSMTCAFKLVVEGRVKFYELATITHEDSSLILRIKHFHADLKGWEHQNQTQEFRLVKVTDKRIYFDGFTFERVRTNELNVYVVIHNGSEKKEVKFNYKKVGG